MIARFPGDVGVVQTRELNMLKSNWAKMVFTILGAPWLLLTLILLPSPMTAMKAEVYSVIIPIGVGGVVISALVEIRCRCILRRRRLNRVIWPENWFG